MRDEYQDLAWEQKKKEWSLWVATILSLIGAIGIIPSGFVKELDNFEISGQVDSIQTTAILRSDRILRRVLGTWGDLLSLKIQWETIN